MKKNETTKTIRVDETTYIDLTLCQDGRIDLAINMPKWINIATMTIDEALELTECLLDIVQMQNNKLKKQNNETN
mgnify:CR=1 FL=1